MIPVTIALRNLKIHWISSIISIHSIALSTTLLFTVWLLIQQTEKSIRQNNGGFDAVLGARGSQLQLVLNSLFHMDSSPGTITMLDYQQIKSHPAVKSAIPIAVGDNFKGFRIVGTNQDYMTLHEYKKGRKFEIEGRVFGKKEKEAVIGLFVAQTLNLKIGDVFHPYHGLQYQESAKHQEQYRVVGILKKTGTPVDRVLWIPLHGVQNMEGHSEEFAQSLSAVLLKLKGKAGFMLQMMYNKQGNKLTFVWPTALVIRNFFAKTEWATLALKIVGVLVAFIATLSNFAILFNSIRERRKELAIFRIIGANKKTLLFSVLVEGFIISAIALLLSFSLYALAAFIIQQFLWIKMGILIELIFLDPLIFYISGIVLIAGILSSIIPGWIAYRNSPLHNIES